MLLGVYQLLQARQAEFTAYADSITALRDYWIARSELERTIGSRLRDLRERVPRDSRGLSPVKP